jgi:hypothetical protein
MVNMGNDAEIADPGNGNVGHAQGLSRAVSRLDAGIAGDREN